MPDTQQPLADLPAFYAGMVGALFTANASFRSAESEALWKGLGSYAIPQASIATTAYIVRDQKSFLFGFIKTGTKEQVVFDTDISFQAKVDPSPPPVPDVVKLNVAKPAFLFDGDGLQSARDKIAQKLHGQGAIVFFIAGDRLVGISKIGNWGKAKAFYVRLSDAVADAVPCLDSELSLEDAEPYLPLIQAVAAWAKSDRTGATRIELDGSTLSAAGASETRVLLSAVAGGWIEARKAGSPANSVPDVPVYAIVNYAAQILLRLDKNGQIAAKDSDDVYRLRLAVSSSGGNGHLDIAIEPSDFLFSGDLRERLLDHLFDQVWKEIWNQIHSKIPILSARAEEFLEAARAGRSEALVFRAERQGDKDTEFFLLRLSWDGAGRTLAITAEATVSSPDTDPLVTLKNPLVLFMDVSGSEAYPNFGFGKHVLTVANNLRIAFNQLAPPSTS